MKEKVFPRLSGYRPLQRRRTTTLCKWLDALNSLGWPADIARLTERPAPDERDSFYSTVMDEILLEIGYRVWLKTKSAGRRERMSDLTLPQNLSASGQELWDWAERLSNVVQLKQEQRDLAAKIKNLTTTCGSCEFWMMSSCPRESRLPSGGKSGPSMNDRVCAKFAITAHSQELVGQSQARLAQIEHESAGGASE